MDSITAHYHRHHHHRKDKNVNSLNSWQLCSQVVLVCVCVSDGKFSNGKSAVCALRMKKKWEKNKQTKRNGRDLQVFRLHIYYYYLWANGVRLRLYSAIRWINVCYYIFKNMILYARFEFGHSVLHSEEIRKDVILCTMHVVCEINSIQSRVVLPKGLWCVIEISALRGFQKHKHMDFAKTIECSKSNSLTRLTCLLYLDQEQQWLLFIN